MGIFRFFVCLSLLLLGSSLLHIISTINVLKQNFNIFLITILLTVSGSVLSGEKDDAWAKANPWFGTNQEMTDFAMKIHNKLKAEGADLGSDQYYKQIDGAVMKAYPSYFISSTELHPTTRLENIQKMLDQISVQRGAKILKSGRVDFLKTTISDDKVIKLSDGSLWEIKSNYGLGRDTAFFISTGPKTANVWKDGSLYGAKLLHGYPVYSSGIFAKVIEKKGDGALLVLDTGQMLTFGSYDQYDTRWWLPPYPVIISGMNMWNLKKDKKVRIEDFIN